MSSYPSIKTYPFLKHYRSKKDGLQQVLIRCRIKFIKNEVLISKELDIPLFSKEGQSIKVTKEELANRLSSDQLKYRLPEVDQLIHKKVLYIIRNDEELTIDSIKKYVYQAGAKQEDGDDMIYNDEVQRFFDHPVPVEVWDTFISEDHRDEISGERVLFEELEDIAGNVESDYYHKKELERIEKLPFTVRYEQGFYNKNNIFDCFGFCWSNNPLKNEPLMAASYRGLLLRLYDYKYNENPPESAKDFNDAWVENFLKFLVTEGYAKVHPKNLTPFTMESQKVALIKSDRLPYKYGAFKKLVKSLRRYIFILQKYKIIDYSRNVEFINADDYVKREVSKTGFTRREHALSATEFSALCENDFSDQKLNLARDMFIIATLGGGFRGEEFYNDQLSIVEAAGNKFIHIYRAKTHSTEINPIFGELAKVIARYNGKLPVFLNENGLRESLRKIADILNLDRVIYSPNTFLDANGGHLKYPLKDIFSIYFARKTFIGILDASGMNDDDIIEFTSHSKTDTLKHYKGKLSAENKIKVLKKHGLL